MQIIKHNKTKKICSNERERHRRRFIVLNLRGDQIGLFKLVTLNCILNRITGVTFGC
jgi:hypothetical protein